MKSTSLLRYSLRNSLLAGLLVVGFSSSHLSLQASAADPFPFKVVEDQDLKLLTLECLNLPTSASQTGSHSSLSKPVLSRVRIENSLQIKDTVYPSGFVSLWYEMTLWLLGDENREATYGKRSQYIQCGQPIQLTQLQKQLKQLRRVLSEVLPGEKADDVGIMSFFDVIPRVENNDTLVLTIEPRRIHDIKIVTWCDWNQWAVDRGGTVPINGQKPDDLIRRTLGIAPGDRLPSHAIDDAAMEKIWSLGLFRVVSFGLGIENDPDKLDWIVCVKQKSEAELAYDEAQRIGSQDSTEAVKRTIEKHKKALLLFRQPKTAPRNYDRPPNQEMKKYRFMSWNSARGAILGKRFPTEADCLVKIAANYTILGEFYQALHYYSQALPLMQQLSDKDGELTVLTELGDIYTTLGDQQQAQQHYQQALLILEKKNQRHRQQFRGNP